MTERFTHEALQRLIDTISDMRDAALAHERGLQSEIDLVHPEYRAGARNLLHYLSLRAHDVRDLQRDLAALGLSSMGRLESHTLSALDAVLAALCHLADQPTPAQKDAIQAPADCQTGPARLAAHAEALLGPSPADRAGRIMVTMPAAAATDEKLVRELLESGMDVMRINGAHDGPAQWEGMIENLHRAREATGRACRVMFDLAGPKLRTGSIAGARRVVRPRPQRDVLGEVIHPAMLWLTPSEDMHAPTFDVSASLPVDEHLIRGAFPGDLVRFKDARGNKREMRIVTRDNTGCVAEIMKTAYIVSHTPLRLKRWGRKNLKGRVGKLPIQPEPLRVLPGDALVLVREEAPGKPARRDTDGTLLRPAHLPCCIGGAFAEPKVGECIWFDDGKIGGEIIERDADSITVRITHANPRGSKLAAGKGLNLPDSKLTMPSVTGKDLEDLDFAVRHADLVSLSFVRRAEDVLALEDELHKRGGEKLGVVLKIETRAGFENLPRLLLAALRSPPAGVMVARGDLAVEIGFERLAEVQEEILWLCEAAHVPVIWATQVLESLAKKGAPSRAEVTDAAMSGRAECVMLNKGPYITQAVRFLSGVLERMEDHQQKKRAMLRKLSVSQLT
ncbi:MAG: pyruvate kinase [Planctomycetota bacterium]|nr:pyruvate kinase [Planctomycetota bacterium]